MNQLKTFHIALTVIFLGSACVDPEDSNQSPATSFSSVISFGDSLSDAGTYQVGLVETAGGGLFTVNGFDTAIGSDPIPSLTWAQLVSAATIGQPSCAARVGGFGVAISDEPANSFDVCRNYAQGGARIFDAKGNGNPVGEGFTDGPLTEPVVKQIEHYTADNGSFSFSGSELITVLAGPNDLFAEARKLAAEAAAAGATAFAESLVKQLLEFVPLAQEKQAALTAITAAIQTESTKQDATPTTIITAALTAANPFVDPTSADSPNNGIIDPAKIGALAQAAASEAGQTYATTTGAKNSTSEMASIASTLAGYVKNMVSNGARYIVVVNIPDISQTPLFAEDSNTRPLILAMTKAFNASLEAGLSGIPGVLYVDAFSENQRQFLDPAHYALSNVSEPACELSFPANVLDLSKDGSGSSLVCNPDNLISESTSRYLFADDVHPTPYGHKLLAQFVTKAMVLAGWF